MRAFVYGFGCYLVVVAVAMWVQATQQQFNLGIAAILSIIVVPVAAVAFRLARKWGLCWS
jgi:hypothetical protein